MSGAEFCERHKDAWKFYQRGDRIAARYHRVVSTSPLTLDNRVFGLEADGTEVELMPHHLNEWITRP